MSSEEVAQIQKLHEYLYHPSTAGASIEEIEMNLYDIPREPGLTEDEIKARQKRFFTHVYNLLIGSDTGPRLATFLWALDRKKSLKLLDVKELV